MTYLTISKWSADEEELRITVYSKGTDTYTAFVRRKGTVQKWRHVITNEVTGDPISEEANKTLNDLVAFHDVLVEVLSYYGME